MSKLTQEYFLENDGKKIAQAAHLALVFQFLFRALCVLQSGMESGISEQSVIPKQALNWSRENELSTTDEELHKPKLLKKQIPLFFIRVFSGV